MTMGQAQQERTEKWTLWSSVVSISSCCNGRGRDGWRRKMINRTRAMVILMIVATTLTSTASGLACVQCNSMDDSSCAHGGGAAKECTGAYANSAYCLKSVGTIVSGKGHFVMRSCSLQAITNCTKEHMLNDLYTVCHYLCAEVGCNTSPGLHPGLPGDRWPFRVTGLAVLAVAVYGLTAALVTVTQ